LGEDAQALRLIGEAVSRDGSDAATWQIMGICFSRLGNVAEAARCFRTILDSIPDHPAALASLAQLDKHTEPS
jgi:Flp pilus assembly protein TadD